MMTLLKDIYDVVTSNVVFNGSGVRISVGGKIMRIRYYRIFKSDPWVKETGQQDKRVNVRFEDNTEMNLALNTFKNLVVYQDEDWGDLSKEVFPEAIPS